MNERPDAKLQEVPIAHYVYRHEAEFAAGFLDDAEIPYRLQVDDASFGVALSTTATIWVRGMDAERAKDILEIDDRPAYLRRDLEPNPDRRLNSPRRRGAIRPPVRSGGSKAARRAEYGLESGPSNRLNLRERGLALIAAGGTVVAGQLLVTDAAHIAIRQGIPVLAAILAIAGLVGWAPSALRRVLAALSGSAP